MMESNKKYEINRYIYFPTNTTRDQLKKEKKNIKNNAVKHENESIKNRKNNKNNNKSDFDHDSINEFDNNSDSPYEPNNSDITSHVFDIKTRSSKKTEDTFVALNENMYSLK